MHFQIFVLFTRLVTNLQSGQTNGFSPVWIRRCIFNCVRSYRLNVLSQSIGTARTGERLSTSVNSKISYQFATLKLVTIWTGKRLLISVNSEMSYQFATSKLVTNWTGKRLLASVNIDDEFATLKLVTNWTGKRLLASVNIDENLSQSDRQTAAWIQKCLINSLLRNLSQTEQANGFSPVWISRWINSLLWNLSQTGQANGFSPVWISTMMLLWNLSQFATSRNLSQTVTTGKRLLASVNIDDEFATLKLVTIWTIRYFETCHNLDRQTASRHCEYWRWIILKCELCLYSCYQIMTDERIFTSVTSTMHTTYTIKWATYVLRLNFMLQSCRAAWILNFRHFTSVNSTILIRDTIHIRDSPNGHFVRTNLLSLTIRRDDAHSNCDPVCERLKCHNQDRRTVFHQCKFYHDAWIIMCYHIVIITECVTYAMSNIEKRSRMQFYSHLGVKIISHVSSQVLKDLT